jgi:DNA ligase-associated metallophosphoesterase
LADPVCIEIDGECFEASPMGALFWRRQRMLVVSDLHLEKGSSFARKGVLLPPYDTRTTIKRLKALSAHYEPDVVISLGDAFHDGDAESRMDERDADELSRLASARRWIWVLGNHDPKPPQRFAGETCAELKVESIIFRHEPTKGPAPGELSGHLHPVAKLIVEGRSFRRRCFATDGARAVLPAFGAYAGGLNVLDEAFASLFAEVRTYVLGAVAVYPITRNALVADPAPRRAANS